MAAENLNYAARKTAKNQNGTAKKKFRNTIRFKAKHTN